MKETGVVHLDPDDPKSWELYGQDGHEPRIDGCPGGGWHIGPATLSAHKETPVSSLTNLVSSTLNPTSHEEIWE